MNIIIMTCIPMIQQHLADLYVESIAKSHPVLLWDLSGLYNRDEQVSHRVEIACGSNRSRSSIRS